MDAMKAALTQDKPYELHNGGYCKHKQGHVIPLPDLALNRAAGLHLGCATPDKILVHNAGLTLRLVAGSQGSHGRAGISQRRNSVYTDGCCPDQHIICNATPNKTGCAVAMLPKRILPSPEYCRGIAFRLETHGPSGEARP